MYTNQQISGDYCIFFTEKIGQGSYANIYGAKQLSTSKLICVKVYNLLKAGYDNYLRK